VVNLNQIGNQLGGLYNEARKDFNKEDIKEYYG
jgi:hypothetical protein